MAAFNQAFQPCREECHARDYWRSCGWSTAARNKRAAACDAATLPLGSPARDTLCRLAFSYAYASPPGSLGRALVDVSAQIKQRHRLSLQALPIHLPHPTRAYAGDEWRNQRQYHGLHGLALLPRSLTSTHPSIMSRGPLQSGSRPTQEEGGAVTIRPYSKPACSSPLEDRSRFPGQAQQGQEPAVQANQTRHPPSEDEEQAQRAQIGLMLTVPASR